MPDVTGYLDENGLLHVPATPEEGAILREMGLPQVTMSTSDLEVDSDGMPVDVTADASVVYGAAPIDTGTPSTLDDVTKSLTDQTAAQVDVITKLGQFDLDKIQTTSENNTSSYELANTAANEQFRRTQRPLARAAATSGFGPGQLARAAQQAATDYGLSRQEADNAYRFAQTGLQQDAALSSFNTRSNQLDAISAIVQTPAEQEQLLIKLLGG